jgi:hypothetical protein
MKYILFCTALLICTSFSPAQNLQELKLKLQQAKTDREKVHALDSLAMAYLWIFQGGKDSIANIYGYEAIAVAEKSGDKELKAEALLSNGTRMINSTQKKGDSIFNYVIQVAQESHLPLYEGRAYLGLVDCDLYRGTRNPELDLKYINLAKGIAESLSDDSLNFQAIMMTAKIYKSKSDNITAFRNYSLALSKAERSEKIDWQLQVNSELADFYMDLGDYDKGLDYARKVQNAQTQNGWYLLGNNGWLAFLYLQAKRYSEVRTCCNRLYELSTLYRMPDAFKYPYESLHYESYIESKEYQEAKSFFSSHPGVAEFYKESNQEYGLYNAYATIFEGEGNRDSADYYFQKFSALVAKTDDLGNASYAYNTYGSFLLRAHRDRDAIVQFEKAKAIALESKQISAIKDTYHNLDTAYFLINDKARAYDYRLLYDKYSDSLQKLSDKKQLTLLEIDHENQRLQQLQKQEEEKTRTRHNIQYIAITVVLASVFILLVLLGFFSTSTAVIRGMGFFAFIFFLSLLFCFRITLFMNGHMESLGKYLQSKSELLLFFFPFTNT